MWKRLVRGRGEFTALTPTLSRGERVRSEASPENTLDLLIVGGGPIGATLALLLRDSGLSYRVLDVRPSGKAGAADRTLALSYNARLLFERIGIWRMLDRVTAIEEIDVSQK